MLGAAPTWQFSSASQVSEPSQNRPLLQLAWLGAFYGVALDNHPLSIEQRRAWQRRRTEAKGKAVALRNWREATLKAIRERRNDLISDDLTVCRWSRHALEQGAAFGPFVAGPEGVVLFEVMMGDPRSWPADPEGFEKLLAEKGAKKLPNPAIDLPDWLEDTRTP